MENQKLKQLIADQIAGINFYNMATNIKIEISQAKGILQYYKSKMQLLKLKQNKYSIDHFKALKGDYTQKITLYTKRIGELEAAQYSQPTKATKSIAIDHQIQFTN